MRAPRLSEAEADRICPRCTIYDVDVNYIRQFTRDYLTDPGRRRWLSGPEAKRETPKKTYLSQIPLSPLKHKHTLLQTQIKTAAQDAQGLQLVLIGPSPSNRILVGTMSAHGSRYSRPVECRSVAASAPLRAPLSKEFGGNMKRGCVLLTPSSILDFGLLRTMTQR